LFHYISKGKTGVAVLSVESERAIFPSASPTGKFNVTFVFKGLPDGITITFEPSTFTIDPDHGGYVRIFISVSKEAPLEGKVDITGKMKCYELDTQNPFEKSLDFSLIITS